MTKNCFLPLIMVAHESCWKTLLVNSRDTFFMFRLSFDPTNEKPTEQQRQCESDRKIKAEISSLSCRNKELEADGRLKRPFVSSQCGLLVYSLWLEAWKSSSVDKNPTWCPLAASSVKQTPGQFSSSWLSKNKATIEARLCQSRSTRGGQCSQLKAD